MRMIIRYGLVLALAIAAAGFASAQTGTLKCVGLCSETSMGHVSYRLPGGTWKVIALGETIPARAEIRVDVSFDWIELRPSNSIDKVYEIDGPDSGAVIKTVAEILKSKPRIVEFPKGSKSHPDPRFMNKLVVTEYLGRQVFMTSDGDTRDIRYGDVLDGAGSVNIIGINCPLTLQKADGAVTTIIGPLNFPVMKVLKNEKLYKYLNVQ
ncbi:MAG TPA: hypothetical protein VMV90_02830 [Rectinemataceae bacterium]|nr:hypothetical protein [Rectinemataceae bacterium]